MLEQAIIENTAAIKELTAVWARLVEQGKKVDPADGISAGGKVIKQPGKSAAAADTSGASTASSQKAKNEQPALEYATVQKAIVALAAKHGRPAALKALEAFGVTSGKDLKPEQWADALAAVNKALEAEAEVA